MKGYREVLTEAREKNIALGHFNFANLEMFWGVLGAAEKLSVPVILGLSEGERDFVGIKQAVAMVKSLRDEGREVFLNADHTYSFERVKEAIDAGFDSVIFDGAKLPIDENIKITKQCVEYARQSGRGVLVEGELGYIGEGSVVRDKLPEGLQITSTEDAKKFVEETGVDLFAPAVGNVHGMLRQGDPALDIGRVREIAQVVKVPLVLHGGSGTPNLGEAIRAGISIVHISTEIRQVWHDALFSYMQAHPDDLAPYKVAHGAMEAVEKVATDRLRLFSNHT